MIYLKKKEIKNKFKEVLQTSKTTSLSITSPRTEMI